MIKMIALKSKQAGLTAVEYCVAGALIVVAITAAVAAFNPKLVSHFTTLLS